MNVFVDFVNSTLALQKAQNSEKFAQRKVKVPLSKEEKMQKRQKPEIYYISVLSQLEPRTTANWPYMKS